MPAILPIILGVAGVLGVIKLLENAAIKRRRVFVSFDYDNDRHYKSLLCAWHANDGFDFTFNDHSSGEVQSKDIGRIKAALTSKIRQADVLLVIIGKESNKPHKDRAPIGYRNWQNFEIAKAKEAKKLIVAVKLDRLHESPEEILGAHAAWAMSFQEAEIMKALRKT